MGKESKMPLRGHREEQHLPVKERAVFLALPALSSKSLYASKSLHVSKLQQSDGHPAEAGSIKVGVPNKLHTSHLLNFILFF